LGTEIEKRLRSPAPVGCFVVPHSTPVIAFGDSHIARVATLGLNPSRAEFLDNTGRLLCDNSARFETMRSLAINDLGAAAAASLEQVLAGCRHYFQRNPYDRWFKQLEFIVAGVGVSYYDGTACHLDLAQWSTDPVWRMLSAKIRAQLLGDGARLLRWQLQTGTVRLLLLNGRSVLTHFQEAFSVAMQKMCTIPGPMMQPIGIMQAELFGGRVQVLGWSTNLQSSFGVTQTFRQRLRETVAERWSLMRAS